MWLLRKSRLHRAVFWELFKKSTVLKPNRLEQRADNLYWLRYVCSFWEKTGIFVSRMSIYPLYVCLCVCFCFYIPIILYVYWVFFMVLFGLLIVDYDGFPACFIPYILIVLITWSSNEAMQFSISYVWRFTVKRTLTSSNHSEL